MQFILFLFGAGMICGAAIVSICIVRYANPERGEVRLVTDAAIEAAFMVVVCFTLLFCIVVLYFPEHMQ